MVRIWKRRSDDNSNVSDYFVFLGKNRNLKETFKHDVTKIVLFIYVYEKIVNVRQCCQEWNV